MITDRLYQLQHNLGYRGLLLVLGVPVLLWVAFDIKEFGFMLLLTVVAGYSIAFFLRNVILRRMTLITIVSNLTVIFAVVYGIVGNFLEIEEYISLPVDEAVVTPLAFLYLALLVMANIIIYSDPSVDLKK